TPGTPTDFLRLELAVLAGGDRALAKTPLDLGDESQNIPFITALCQSFQAKGLEYYNEGVDAQDRLERLGGNSQKFREISLTKGGKTFTIASSNAGKSAEEAYAIGAEGCPPGTTCVDRACVSSDKQR